MHACMQAAVRKGVHTACAVVRALGPTLPFPGEQVAGLLLTALELTEQVIAKLCRPCRLCMQAMPCMCAHHERSAMTLGAACILVH